MNTTDSGQPKFLHWFEWEKRELHFFDCVNYISSKIKLVIPFKIPPFSRSIMLPNTDIYLLGGEDSELGAINKTYLFRTEFMEYDHSLHEKKPMPHKKFDFTICHFNNVIYVICGKDENSEVVNTCEAYSLNTDTWKILSRVNYKRYAASSVVAKEVGKIFLFGGRSDQQNLMMEQIEEYDITRNLWKVIRIKGINEWIPVEVCSAIQVKVGKILIFGGSDVAIEDSNNAYLFDIQDYSLKKIDSLKKAHVFVANPFLYGNYVFAIGNEYYVKSRNIHRYNIKKKKWEIVF